MYAITGNGLEKYKPFTVTPGAVYYLGASDMPTRIRVMAVTADRIVYAATHRGTKTIIDRRIGEDLIARGCATIARRYVVYPSVVEAIGKVAPAEHFNHYRVNVRPVEGVWNSDANWRGPRK